MTENIGAAGGLDQQATHQTTHPGHGSDIRVNETALSGSPIQHLPRQRVQAGIFKSYFLTCSTAYPPVPRRKYLPLRLFDDFLQAPAVDERKPGDQHSIQLENQGCSCFEVPSVSQHVPFFQTPDVEGESLVTNRGI